jgi:hypothetical protein
LTGDGVERRLGPTGSEEPLEHLAQSCSELLMGREYRKLMAQGI